MNAAPAGLRRLSALLFPPVCLACHGSLGPRELVLSQPHEALCDDCRRLLRPLDLRAACSRCGLSPCRTVSTRGCEDCHDLEDSFTAARSIFPYQSPAGLIVRNLKYHRSPWLADWLVALCRDVAGEWLTEYFADAILVAVPMALTRELRRGYNQAHEIARAISTQWNLDLAPPDTIVRARRGKPQARHHSREQRRLNLDGAFELKRPKPLHQRRIVLVDDVMTTGCTIAAAAACLHEAKPREVALFTPVRARLRQDDDADLAR